MKPRRYGDIEEFAEKLRVKGYNEVRIIDTAQEVFVSRKRARALKDDCNAQMKCPSRWKPSWNSLLQKVNAAVAALLSTHFESRRKSLSLFPVHCVYDCEYNYQEDYRQGACLSKFPILDSSVNLDRYGSCPSAVKQDCRTQFLKQGSEREN